MAHGSLFVCLSRFLRTLLFVLDLSLYPAFLLFLFFSASSSPISPDYAMQKHNVLTTTIFHLIRWPLPCNYQLLNASHLTRHTLKRARRFPTYASMFVLIAGPWYLQLAKYINEDAFSYSVFWSWRQSMRSQVLDSENYG